MYGNTQLFTRLWPKLLKSAATEALADLDDKKKFAAPTVKGAETFLAEATAEPARDVNLVANDGAQGQAANHIPARAPGARQTEATASPSHVRIVRYDGKKAIAVECQDKAMPGVVIHRSYIAK